jgi:NitT/TauT family transport system substrate-binding protein
MNHSKKIWVFVFIVGIFTIVYMMFHNDKKTPRFKLNVAFMDWPGYYPLIVAHKKNYFSRLGLDVNIINCNDNLCTNDKLIQGEAHIAYGALADYVMMRGNGHKIKLIYLCDYSKMDSLVGRYKLAQLNKINPLKIGIGDLHSFSEFFVLEILRKNKINLKNVIFKVVPYSKVDEALRTGEIDLGHTWEPELSKILKNGFQVADTAASIPGVISDSLAIREDLIPDPAITKNFMTAIHKAVLDLISTPDEVAKIIADELHKSPIEVTRLLSESIQITGFIDNLKAYNSKNTDFTSLDFNITKVSEFLIQRGQITNPVKIDELIDFLPLESTLMDAKNEN